ncbi:MAG: N-acetylneuraminate synthase family protein [bacterium]
MRNKNSVKFIAEVSSNHNRDLKRCLRFIKTAAEIGCDAVKFQLFKIDKLFAPEIVKKNKEIQKRKQWELPVAFLPELAQACKNEGIEFSCTPFYLDAVDELLPYVDFYKIASYELLWDDLLKKCAKTGKPIILSTGMATLKEVEKAVRVLRDSGCEDMSLLHCVSSYPVPVKDCNLAAIKTLADKFNCPVGWSDHTVKENVIWRAVCRWQARIVEFHLDLDGEGEEFKSGHCWLPHKIGAVIKDIRESFTADGTGLKEPAGIELAEREWRADTKDGLRPILKIRK